MSNISNTSRVGHYTNVNQQVHSSSPGLPDDLVWASRLSLTQPHSIGMKLLYADRVQPVRALMGNPLQSTDIQVPGRRFAGGRGNLPFSLSFG